MPRADSLTKLLNKSVIIPLLFVELITFFLYGNIIFGFFQQDEWLSFSFHSTIDNILTTAFAPSVGHYQPFNTIFIHLLISAFELNYVAYAIVSIFLHMANVLVVYFLAKEITGNIRIGILTSLFFGISASAYEATSWVMADIGIHLSTFFGILSLLFLFKFLKSKKNYLFGLSMVFVLTSILFKESTIGLFALIPVIIYFFGTINNKGKRKFILIVIGIAVIYVLFRLSMVFMPQSYSRETLVTNSQSIRALFVNIISFPFISLTQSIIPSSILLKFSYLISNYLPNFITGQKLTTTYDLFVQKKVLEILNIGLSVLLIGGSFWFYLKDKKSPLIKAMFFGILLVIFNSSIYALSPEKNGIITIMDSRNLYFVLIGTSIFLASLFIYSSEKKYKVATLILGFLLIMDSYLVIRNIEVLRVVGSQRRAILDEIKIKYPALPSKTVFYVISDTSYYGLRDEEKILPFQSGLGQTLLVWYRGEDLPKQFYQNKYLWEITDQDYKEHNNRGFGYFRDPEELKKIVNQYQLSPDSIIAFSWKSKTGQLIDITIKTRKEIFNQ